MSEALKRKRNTPSRRYLDFKGHIPEDDEDRSEAGERIVISPDIEYVILMLYIFNHNTECSKRGRKL